MTSPLNTGNRWAVVGVAVFLLGCTALIVRETLGTALINESPSLPKGLYLRSPGASPDRASIVAVPQPAVARAYLGALGAPAGMLLIKRVSAVEGDIVCRWGARVTTPDRTVAALARDRRGVALPVWSGCRRLEAGDLFLLGDTASSFDSRYFGPVRRSEVAGVYREVLTW
ncbi:MAG: S26 family signal peptidase [Proteobacteria bacterium]|nr:S26 family signal peptidase [Pseudomonadota bacterium]